MKKIELKTGLLEVSNSVKLNNLIAYGSRINTKRRFFFISKVTGKHLPTKPSDIQKTYCELSKMIPKSNDFTLFIGLAEAATALSQGVFKEYGSKNSFFIHTTRYKTKEKMLFCFQEEHSHAPLHIVYKPKGKFAQELKKVKRIVFIDDEVTTGKTVDNMIEKMKSLFVNVKKYYLLSIVDWSKKTHKNFTALPLYKSEFRFKSNQSNINNSIKSMPTKPTNLNDIIPYNFGRYGLSNFEYDVSSYVNIADFIDKKVLVLGTSEFTYVPFLLALYLEQNGINALYQSTSRSPLNIDGEISSIIKFKDNYGEEIDNFLYNVENRDYDTVIICYETVLLPKSYNLKEQLEKKFEVREIFFKQ